MIRISNDDDFQPLRCSSQPSRHPQRLGSGALKALPVSAKRSADRISHNVADELAEHDAAVDEVYRHLMVKASKTSPAKPKEKVRN